MFPRPHLQYRVYNAAEAIGHARVFAGWPKRCEFPPPTAPLIIDGPLVTADLFDAINKHLKEQP
jgi:hypothetical protein